ncbi:MAG TPA: helix-hairpin-helix domain-containing protein [Solirubrobacterales bacterium]|nr:helix-hairpin-helix domain-containing protein [Solirubrobacterales bacterium]
MPELSRSQVLVYGAVAVALLLVGARAIRGEGATASSYADSPGGSASSGSSSSSFTVTGQASDVVVDVSGAVARPGVYRLPAGSRVDDAVRRAGGPAARADLEAVNLAARLTDGQQIVVPERGASAPTASPAAAEEGPIGLGAATVEQLDTIDGIGPVTAEDIIEFREQHGGLSSVEQLDQVPGIGPATMEALRSRLQP